MGQRHLGDDDADARRRRIERLRDRRGHGTDHLPDLLGGRPSRMDTNAMGTVTPSRSWSSGGRWGVAAGEAGRSWIRRGAAATRGRRVDTSGRIGSRSPAQRLAAGAESRTGRGSAPRGGRSCRPARSAGRGEAGHDQREKTVAPMRLSASMFSRCTSLGRGLRSTAPGRSLQRSRTTSSPARRALRCRPDGLLLRHTPCHGENEGSARSPAVAAHSVAVGQPRSERKPRIRWRFCGTCRCGSSANQPRLGLHHQVEVSEHHSWRRSEARPPALEQRVRHAVRDPRGGPSAHGSTIMSVNR